MTTNESLKAYIAVRQDLQVEHDDLQEEIAPKQARIQDLKHSINLLSEKISKVTADPSSSSSRPAIASRRYMRMSIHWAILDLLIDSQPMTASEIADAILSGGYPTKSAPDSFVNNVSAVLSVHSRDLDHKEVQQLSDGKWDLTPQGKEKIAYIRTTPKFKNSLPWS